MIESVTEERAKILTINFLIKNINEEKYNEDRNMGESLMLKNLFILHG